MVDEIDLRKCIFDVDKKFKVQNGIILTLPQWDKLKKAVNYMDRRIAKKQKELDRFSGMLTFGLLLGQ